MQYFEATPKDINSDNVISDLSNVRYVNIETE